VDGRHRYAGRFLLSAFLGTAAGARFQARFEADSAGVYVRPPEYKSRMRWIIPLVIALRFAFRLSPPNMC
jgi:branched-chain amino acid transport system permease protein